MYRGQKQQMVEESEEISRVGATETCSAWRMSCLPTTHGARQAFVEQVGATKATTSTNTSAKNMKLPPVLHERKLPSRTGLSQPGTSNPSHQVQNLLAGLCSSGHNRKQRPGSLRVVQTGKRKDLLQSMNLLTGTMTQRRPFTCERSSTL